MTAVLEELSAGSGLVEKLADVERVSLRDVRDALEREGVARPPEKTHDERVGLGARQRLQLDSLARRRPSTTR